jgi:phage shock protein PspC (stress-responsive transcriptional regulator)
MKKVVTIHLSGKLFQIEEDAYKKLEEVLYRIRLGEPHNVETIEATLAEQFNNRVELGQKVITFQMVYEILRNQGLLNNGQQERDETYDRLYRRTNDKVLGGVCSGLGYYWHTDPILIRLLFIVLFFGFGTGFLIYLIMWIVIPKA